MFIETMKLFKESTEKLEPITEKELSSKERNKLDDKVFGIPELRKYPLIDKEHVSLAIKWFNKSDEKYRDELCDNICKRATELGMKDVSVSNKNCFKDYLEKVEPDYKYFLKVEEAIHEETEEQKMIKDGGKEIDGRWNSVEEHPQYPGKLLRHRVEMLVFNDKKQIFLQKTGNTYRIPGGSIEKKVSNMNQAIKEVEEEARLKVKNVKYSNISYYLMYDVPDQHGIRYDGEYTEVYIGEFDKLHQEEIDPRDNDSEMRQYGRFYDYVLVKDILSKEHNFICMGYISGLDITNEAASPIEFDDKGNLIINKKKTDLQSEYNSSHTLLKNYEQTNNTEAMKTEICKLWYINSLIEKRLEKKTEDRKILLDIRARVLNDFNKYLKIISTNEEGFDFTIYIKSTIYDPDNLIVTKSTIFKALDFVKGMKKQKKG